MADIEQAQQQANSVNDSELVVGGGDATKNHDARSGGKKRRKTRSQRRRERDNTNGFKPPVDQRKERTILMENANLITFYKAQPFFNDGEFDTFLQWLRTSLPASFRINAFEYEQARFLRRLVEGGPELCDFLITTDPNKDGDGDGKTTELADRNNDDHDDVAEESRKNHECQNVITDNSLVSTSRTLIEKPPTIEPLPWYPRKLAWQMNVTRIDLKKSPALQGLHKFIMAESESGFISRQESVSMIPPLLLDVCRGHNILDMCAAPGSKTAQLLEYLKFDIFDTGKHEQFQPSHAFDDGLVVANDLDNKRCYMLVHQAMRLNSPNCVIINEDAARLPNMKTLDSNGVEQTLKFDRILCDVPCSGDGTIRKNPDVWRKWSIGNANNFHGMQTKIAKRGLELLKEDGLLVYSTCSMNPSEDESVVAAILRAAEGRVVLEDVSTKLKGLKYRPGVSNWVVMGKDVEPIPSQDQVKPDQASQCYPSLFPPNEDEAKQFHLDRCLRILPHFQNTGAFFVAVLRKLKSTLPWEDEKNTAEDNSTKPLNKPPNPKKRRYCGFKEDPFLCMDSQDPDWVTIKKAFGFDDKFPVDQLIHRCSGAGKKRFISLVSKRTKDFMMINQEAPDKQEFVKLINGGMRLFAKADCEAGFRICQDGVSEVVDFVQDKLKVSLNKSDLIGLLKNHSVSFEGLSCGAYVRDQLTVGSVILLYKHEGDESGGKTSFQLPLVGWRGEKSVALYVSKTHRLHLCALIRLNLSEAVLT